MVYKYNSMSILFLAITYALITYALGTEEDNSSIIVYNVFESWLELLILVSHIFIISLIVIKFANFDNEIELVQDFKNYIHYIKFNRMATHCNSP